MEEELKFNGKTYRRVDGNWTLPENSIIVNYDGKTYKKIFDDLGLDPKETCINKCVFCERDENCEPCCGAMNKKFWGCNAGFHWEEV